MSEQQQVRLQIFVDEPLRRRLKAESAALGLDMSELGSLILDYALHLIEADKTPPELVKSIDKFKKDKAAADK